MFCVLSATRWKSPKLLACVSLILIQGIIEPTKNYVSNLADESWPRGLLNKTCNENSVFVDDEKFDTKRFKTRWTLVQLKNIYAVSFNKLPIFDPNAFYVFDRKKSCNNEGGDSSMKSYEIISYILGRAVTLNGSYKDFPGPC